MQYSARLSPLDLAALKWVDEPSDRPLLALALWGLDCNLAPLPLGNTPTEEAIADKVRALLAMPPEASILWVEGGVEGETVLPAEAIAEATDAQEAAAVLLKTIADLMMEEEEE